MIRQFGKSKITRLTCTLLFTTALLKLPGMVMTSYADSVSHTSITWESDTDGVQCFDKEGNPVTDTWIKKGARYYYMDENGFMATDRLIEDDDNIYYVGTDGDRAANRWVSIPNTPGTEALCEQNVSTIWYYMGASGKAYIDGKKTIGGKKYIFDEDGHMLSGWQLYGEDDDLYYLGTENEGWIHTGWQYLEPWDEMFGAYEGDEWFYFRPSSGKAYRDAKKRINSHVYRFDENGVMEGGWSLGTSSNALASGSDSEAVWFDEGTGQAETGWLHAYDPEDTDKSGEEYWYYLDRKGVPFNYGGKDALQSQIPNAMDEIENVFLYGCAAKVIGGKTYLFNNKGQMVTGYIGLYGVRREGGGDLGLSNWTYYYFNSLETEKEGRMMTGKQTVYDSNGEEYCHVYLQDNGEAYTTAIADGILYDPTGHRFEATTGEYDLLNLGKIEFTVNGSNQILTNCHIIVNSAGKVKKSGTVTFGGYRYTVRDYKVVGREQAE